MKNKTKFLLLLLIVIAGITRIYQLGKVPDSLYWDEVAIGVDALSVARYGKDMHGNPAAQAIFPSYGDYKLPGYILMDAIVVKLFGLSPFSVRLPSALAGVSLVMVMYAIGKSVFKRESVGLAVAGATAILPVDLLFSRTGFEGHLALFFVAATMWCWMLSVKRIEYCLLSVIPAALAMYTYFSARIVLPLLAAVTLVLLFRKTTNVWKAAFIASVIISVLTLIPMYQSPYYNSSNQVRLSASSLLDTNQFAIQSNILREFDGNNFLSRIIYHRYLLQAKAIARNIFTHIDPDFLFLSGDQNLRHSTKTVGIMYLSMLPFFLIGWWALFKFHPSVGLWLLALWLISVVPAAIPVEVPHALRSLNVVIPLTLVLGFGFDVVWRYQPRAAITALLFIAIEGTLTGHDYLVHYPSRSAKSWQSGYLELAFYLKNHESQFDRAVIDVPDDRIYLYFLFANPLSPDEFVPLTHNFRLSKFGKYQFGRHQEITNQPTDWLVVDVDKWASLGKPQAEFISTYSQPRFAIIEGWK